MRLNPSTGAAALGVSTNISIDGVVPAQLVGVGAQYPTWFNAAGNVIFYADVDNSELRTLDLDGGFPVTQAPGGTFRLAAGADKWVSALTLGVNQGVRSNIAGWVKLSLAGLGDMDEAGRFAIIQAFAQDRGIQCYSAAGAITATFDVPLTPSAVVRCKSGIVAFSGAGWNWQLRSLVTGALVPFARRETGVIETVPLTLASGRTMVVERTGTDTLTLREATSGEGYVLSSTIVFNPDAIELSPGVIRVGWSSGSSETPTQLRMVDITLAGGSTTTWTSASGSLVSSAGPTLSASPMPVGAVEGSGLADLFLNRHPFTEPDTGVLTTSYGWPFLQKLVKKLGLPVDLSTQVTGVLGPENGGTGNTGGTSVIDGSNITIGIIPPNVLSNVPNVGYWTLLSAGPPLNLEEIVAQAGSWSPLMSGPDAATSELVLDINGDCIPIWIAAGTQTILPPLVDDGSGAPIAVFVPVTDEAYT